MYIFDTHEDIADALIYSTHGNFWYKNNLHDGWNNLKLPVNNQVDIVRLKEAQVKAVFGVSCAFSIDEQGNIIPDKNHLEDTLKQLDMYHNLVSEGEKRLHFIKTKSDLDALQNHDVSFLLTIEGADSIDDELNNLQLFFDKGVRCIGLTWSYDNRLAGGCNENGELTELGKKTIQKMEELGILLDLSHINEKSFYQALSVTQKPVIISHTAAKTIYDHPRNVTDDQMKAIAKTGGAVGICGVPKFIGVLTLDAVSRHIKHAIDVVGVDHVIVGTDFGSMTSPKLIADFQEVSDLPKLIEKLRENGLDELALEKLAHENIERIVSETLPNA